MTATVKPEIGSTVVANGIETNYLEDGSGDDTVLLIHGSGPGVTSYANWRLVIPALATKFRVIAPDMVGFGFSERPRGRQVQRADVGGSNRRADGCTGSREDQSGRQQLRRRHCASHRDATSRAHRQAGPDGQHGRALPDHRGPRAGVGVRGVLREHAQGARCVRLLARAGERRTRPGALRGQHSAGIPGVVLVDVSCSAPALGRGDVHAGRGHPTTSAPDADHSRPRGPGDPATDVAAVGTSSSTTPICPSIRTAATGR